MSFRIYESYPKQYFYHKLVENSKLVPEQENTSEQLKTV